jgi:hypothetical protein
MSLSLPQARSPIGWVDIAGRRTPVVIDLEWMRSLTSLVERAGGVSGSSTTDLAAEAFEDAGIEEGKAALYALRDEAWSMPPITVEQQVQHLTGEVAELMATVAELTKQLEGVRMGVAA